MTNEAGLEFEDKEMTLHKVNAIYATRSDLKAKIDAQENAVAILKGRTFHTLSIAENYAIEELVRRAEASPSCIVYLRDAGTPDDPCWMPCAMADKGATRFIRED